MKRKTKTLTGVLAVVSLVTASSAASADDAAAASSDSGIGASASVGTKEPIGLSVGLGLGYALSAGNVDRNDVTGNDEKLGDFFSHGIPIALDVGYQIDPNIDIGIGGQYALLAAGGGEGCGNPAPQGSGLRGNLTCSGSSIRLGVDARYHIQRYARIDPWFLVGIGYEWMHRGLSGSGGGSASQNAMGLELGRLQFGADYEVAPRIRVGPFLGVSIAQYQRLSNGSATASILNKGLHEWWTFGVRGVYGL
jgi:hypothetical protein